MSGTHADRAPYEEQAAAPEARRGPAEGVAAGAAAPLGLRCVRTVPGVVALQCKAGSHAVAVMVQRQARLSVQRQGLGGRTSVPFRGQTFTADPVQLRTLLENLVGERGQDEADTIAHAFLTMGFEEKAGLQLRGVEPATLTEVQGALRPVLEKLQGERKPYLAEFRATAVKGTLDVLDRTHEQLKAQRDKYTGDEPGGQPPDLDGLCTAAKALAAKRRAADAAAATAKEAFEKMRTQLQAPAHPGSFVPPPIVPYFPDQALKEAAGTTNEAWWKQEQEYGALRRTHEATFPVLSMYASNDDGAAAERLEDLPTWGPFADFRMKRKIVEELLKKIENNRSAAQDLGDADRVWSLPQMVDAALRGQAAPAYKQRWVKAEVARVQAEAAETQKIIAAVALGVALVAGAATLGVGAAPAGSATAVVLAGLTTGAQAASTGITIALAYKELRDYQFQVTSSDTALDKAQAIAHDDPSWLWLAVQLAGVILEVQALRASFTLLKGTIQTYKASRDVAGLAEKVAATPGVPPATANTITKQVAAEIEALPPLPTSEAGLQAMERLGTWDAIPAAERGQVVLDALGSTDVAGVLTRTGRNATQLLADLGRESAAGRRLLTALNTRAYQMVADQLRAIAPGVVLDEEAIGLIVSQNSLANIKGQILEEVMAFEMRRTLAAGADDAARQALVRGAEGSGQAEFIHGSRISDTWGDKLTDGMVAILRDPDEVVVIRALEAKTKAVKGKLSREAKVAFEKLPETERNQLLEDGAKILRRRRPDLASASVQEIIANHNGDVMTIVNSHFKQTSQFGQAVKTSERLAMDLNDDLQDIPAQILIDGQRRKVVFPGGEGRPLITGMVPSDVPVGTMGQKVTEKGGARLEIQQVSSVDQARINSLGRAVAEAKFLAID
jgi:hypothetical protein